MPAKPTKDKSTFKNEPVSSDVQVVKPEPLKVLLEWKSSIRPFKKRDKEFFTTVLAIAFLIGIILLFIEGWLPVAVIIAFVFLIYVLGTIPPGDVDHKITNRGIVTGEKTYRWNELGRFWVSEKWHQKMLQVETFVGLSRRITLLLGDLDPEKIKTILSEYLLFEEPEKTWSDKASEWLARNVPLEKS